jgi:hypothetical protein
LAVHRILLALLIAVSVVLAPISGAMAASAQSDSAAMADMPDCPNKAPKQTSKECGCCDTKVPCQSNLCLAKCLKLTGDIIKNSALIRVSEAIFITAVPIRPPDSWPEPHKRPPRT